MDKKAVSLHSAALTNTPAIDAMTPIACSDKLIGGEDGADQDSADQNGVDQDGAENNGKGTLEALATLLQLRFACPVTPIVSI